METEQEQKQMVANMLDGAELGDDLQGHQEGAITLTWSLDDVTNEFVPDEPNRVLDFDKI